MATQSGFVRDVDDMTFQSEVLDRSKTVPVVVDFWAPWCGPCRMLGPVLERLAEQHAGAFELAKVNTDENPRISQMFGISSIPAVKAFKDGRLVNEFVGALPESRVRAFLEPLLPSEADRQTARGDELAAAGHLNAAEDAYREALAQQSVHAGATVGLARILAGRGDGGRQEALRLLSSVPNDPAAVQLRAEISLSTTTASEDTQALEQRVQLEPRNAAARLELGRARAASGRHEPALEQLLESVRLDRAFEDDAARKAMLSIFDLLGAEHPLTQDYRRRLSRVLF